MNHRNYVVFYVNGKRVQVSDERIFMPLANFLRYERNQTGTKIVCAEGDCGACTILQARPKTMQNPETPLEYVSCNSCILPVFLVDGCSIVTVEGMEISKTELDPIQKSFVACNASQCGFCTPGFIMATASLYEQKQCPTPKDVKNYLTGNLCRCTGYDSIIKAGCNVDNTQRQKIQERYFDAKATQDLLEHRQIPIEMKWNEAYYFAPTTLSSAVSIQKNYQARLISGATDLGVQINKGRFRDKTFLDLRLIPQMYEIAELDDCVKIGAKVNWEDMRRFIKKTHPEYAEFLHLFASPQIKNVGTLIGNVANASPIADSTPYLMAAEATIHLIGHQGEREVPMVDFYKGYKILNMKEGEFITHISIPKQKQSDIAKLYKISARRDLDISCVNMAVIADIQDGTVHDIRLAYGGVGPVVKRICDVESFLKGKLLDSQTILDAVSMVSESITPISDVRGSMQFRTRTAQNLLKKFFFEIQQKNPTPETSFAK